MRIILCCGEHGRAVIIGDVDEAPVPGQPVTLRDARMVLYWSAQTGGLFGLAARGPREGCRITAAVSETTATVWQEWLTVSDDAAEGLDAWPAI